MNRIEEFKQLIKEWLELELEKTCVSLDTFTSMAIVRSNPLGKGGTIAFNKKTRGVETEECRVYLTDDNEVDSLVCQTSTPIVGLMIFALEKAIKDY